MAPLWSWMSWRDPSFWGNTSAIPRKAEQTMENDSAAWRSKYAVHKSLTEMGISLPDWLYEGAQSYQLVTILGIVRQTLAKVSPKAAPALSTWASLAQEAQEAQARKETVRSGIVSHHAEHCERMSHDGFALHSHENRSDHLNVPRTKP
jgi:hypothetical protein